LPQVQTATPAPSPADRSISVAPVSDFAPGSGDGPGRRPLERAKMPAQARELRKNYIGISDDQTDEQRAIAWLVKSDRVLKDALSV
jgi:hypothetical protein